MTVAQYAYTNNLTGTSNAPSMDASMRSPAFAVAATGIEPGRGFVAAWRSSKKAASAVSASTSRTR